MQDFDGKLKSISKILDKVGAEIQLDRMNELSAAVSSWEQVVGPKVAAHTKPVMIEDRALIVEVEGAAWAQEIAFRKKAVIDGVNNSLGRSLLKEVRTRPKT